MQVVSLYACVHVKETARVVDTYKVQNTVVVFLVCVCSRTWQSKSRTKTEAVSARLMLLFCWVSHHMVL